VASRSPITHMMFAQAGAFEERAPRYHIQPSDALEVHYRYSPEFDQTVTVQPDGFTALTLAGDIKLDGLTVDQAKAAMLARPENGTKAQNQFAHDSVTGNSTA
jgi:protein involved in polysaccharide export with SLBB domain